MVLSLKKVFGH